MARCEEMGAAAADETEAPQRHGAALAGERSRAPSARRWACRQRVLRDRWLCQRRRRQHGPPGRRAAMNTPREFHEPKRKNGGAKIVPTESSKSLVATTVAHSTDDAVKWWRAFKRFMADADALKEYHDSLWQERMSEYPRTAADLEEDAQWCQEQVAKCRAGFECYDPDANYEQQD